MAEQEQKSGYRYTQADQDHIDVSNSNLMESSLQDIRYGLRAMRRNPTFFAIAVLMLALGIGVSTAVFSLVNTILLKPMPYPKARQIVVLWRTGPLDTAFTGPDKWPWAPTELQSLQQTSSVFQNLGAFKKESFNLTGSNDPVLLEGVRVSAGFFPALGTSPLLGRVFGAEDDQPGHEHVAVLSNRLWMSRFGGDPGIAGKVIDLNGYPYTVVGVMPANFTFPDAAGMPAASVDLPRETQLWVPLALPAAARGSNEIGVIGELKPGVRTIQVQQDLALSQKRLEGQFPGEKGWSSFAVPLTQQSVMDTRRPLLLLFGAVSLVLLIACSNVAGLVLNRSLGRRRELSLRGALGAGRKRLIRQLMTEGLLLAFAAGGIGILLGEITVYLVKRFGPESIPHLHETGLDLRVIFYALTVTVLTGLLFGLAPAIGATRMNLVETLKEGGQRAIGGAIAPKLRHALLVAQIALALVLVIAAGLLVRTFYHMLRADAGFEATRVITFELPLPSSKYSDTGRMAQVYQQVLSRVQAIAGVQSAGFNSVVPLGGAPDGTMIRIPQHPATSEHAQPPFANYSFVSPGYFTALGTTLMRGRDIADQDTLDAMRVAVINNAMAKKYWPGEDPIGKQVGVGLVRYPVRTIVGVVDDIKHASLREEPAPEMYVPYTQNEIKVWPSMQSMQFAVRTKVDPASITGSIRQAVHAVDPDLPIAKLATLTTMIDDSMTADRFSMLLVSCFGALALMLASIGMYGAISYSVMQRTSEIGIRMALGAPRMQIFAMVIGQAGRIGGVGIAIGLVAALITTRLMTRFLYGVQPTDPVTFVLVSLLLVAIAVLAAYAPARKAMKVDPMVALRYE